MKLIIFEHTRKLWATIELFNESKSMSWINLKSPIIHLLCLNHIQMLNAHELENKNGGELNSFSRETIQLDATQKLKNMPIDFDEPTPKSIPLPYQGRLLSMTHFIILCDTAFQCLRLLALPHAHTHTKNKLLLNFNYHLK